MKYPRLKIDADGDGAVTFPAEFRALSWIERADLLKGWLHDMTNEYNATLEEFLNRDKPDDEAQKPAPNYQ